jgi:hypothetical protein
VSVTHTHGFSASSVLDSSLHVSRHYQAIDPIEEGILQLHPEQDRGRHFNRQERRTRGWQWTEKFTWTGLGSEGDHALVAGFDVLHTELSSEGHSLPVEILRLDETLARRVSFGPGTRQDLSTTDLAVFVRHRWQPSAATTLEAGLRLDRDGVLGGVILAPRLAATISPFDERLRIGLSFGLSAERTPSLVGTFESMEERTEARFAEDGITPLGATRYTHVVAPGLVPASSRSWAVDVRFAPRPGLDLRATYLDRRGQHEIVVSPEGEGLQGRLVLGSEGRSQHRELELGLRYSPTRWTSLDVSWILAKSRADLNTFASLFGNSRAPVIRPNEYGPGDREVPSRLLVRWRQRFGERWACAALLDWRRGFPFSALDENLEFVGPRNAAGRFPTSAMLELSVERRFRVARWEPWLGLALLNALNADAPSEVQTNLSAPDYGSFYNGVPRRLKLIIRLSR